MRVEAVETKQESPGLLMQRQHHHWDASERTVALMVAMASTETGAR